MDLCRVNGYGWHSPPWMSPAPLPRPLSSQSLATLVPVPCRAPLAHTLVVSMPRTVPRTGPVSARLTLTQSPDMNLVSPASRVR